MSRIHDVPDSVSDAGLDFNFNVWTQNSRITLGNVPWNSDYRDIVRFPSTSELDSYIDNLSTGTTVVEKLSYIRPGQAIRLPIAFNRAYKFNYLRVENPATHIPGDMPRSFYYFILDIRYASPGATEFIVQLDVWQSFGREIEFGRCYVERGHIGIANEDQMLAQGRTYLTVPEGLDLGGEYTITANQKLTLADTSAGSTLKPGVVVATTVSLEQSGGTVDNPIINTAKGSDFEGLPNGVELYLFDSASFKSFMAHISTRPWISQGIISVMAVPWMNPATVETESVMMVGGYTVDRLKGHKIPNKSLKLFSKFRESSGFRLPNRYSHLKKFMTYPYSLIEVTTYSGTPLVLKPECISDEDCNMVQMTHIGIPGSRIVFWPYKYNGHGEETDTATTEGDNAEYLDMITGIFDLPTFSVVNNSYMTYLAANRNSIAYQHSSADWSQQKALQGASLAANQTSAGMANQREQTNISLRAQSQQTALTNDMAWAQSGLSAAGGIASGAVGGPAGAAAGAASGAMQLAGTGLANAGRTAGMEISQTAARQGLASNQGTTGYIRDSNLEFAQNVAKGDYGMMIAGINAKVQDAKMIQPTTAGQLGGDAFNLAMDSWALYGKIKRIHSGTLRAIGEYWLRYGYAVNGFTTPPRDLMVMEKFTYWKLLETYIRSATCPESYRQTIRGIFEKGVTVWKNPDDIGFLDVADNMPIGGVSLELS